MALLNVVGFDTGDQSEMASGTGSISLTDAVTRSGTGYAFRSNPTTTATGYCFLKGLAADGTPADLGTTTPYVGLYFRYGTKPAANNEPLLALSGSGDLVELRITSAGNLAVYLNNALLGSAGSTALAADTWYRLGFKCVSGAWEVRVNGSVELSGTDSISGTMNTLEVGKSRNRNNQTVNFYFDDVLVSDSALPADAVVKLLVPNANGTYGDWAVGAGSGSHYEIVDEVPPDDDTSYLVSPNIGFNLNETLAVAFAPSPAASSILAVKPVVRVKQNNTGGDINVRFRSGTTDTDLSAYTLTGSYVGLSQVYETDPATSAAWTTAGVDGCEAGAVAIDTTNRARMTFAGISVAYVEAASSGGAARLLLLGVG